MQQHPTDDDLELPTNALVSFRMRNVRSYRDDTTLSLRATRLANAAVVRAVPTAAVAPDRLLPAVGLFGANAAGKSTMLRAMADMRALVLNSFRHGEQGSGMFRRPFLLDVNAGKAASEFEVEVILNGVRWHYGFEVDDEEVLREFAFHYPRRRQALVFERDMQTLTFGTGFQAARRFLGPFLRDNALVLSVLGTADDDLVGPLFHWFRHNLRLAASSNRGERAAFTTDLAKSEATRARVLNLLQAADLGVAGIDTVKLDADVIERLHRAAEVLRGDEPEDEVSSVVIEDMIQLQHRGAGEAVPLHPADESLGTQVWVGLIGPVLQALDEGTVLLVDELDASLHPMLVAEIVDLFQCPATNRRCAQLIFNSHDISILDDKEPWAIGRDQIWLAEKNVEGASELYALADFRGRRDESVGRRYMRGRYGGVPMLDPARFRSAVRATQVANPVRERAP